MTTVPEVLIQPSSGLIRLDFGELWRYRELLGFLIWRDIKIRYKQTALGGLWAVFQPLAGMIVFGVLFTRVARIDTGGVPYMLFVYAGLVPWTFFANAVSLASNSLLGSEQMVRKSYFPRILVPSAAVLALALDMSISLGFMGVLMAAYGWGVQPNLLLLPLFILSAVLTASGAGYFLAALNVQYRDVKYIVPFFMQMAMFLTPVIYPSSRIPPKFQFLLAMNPMAGIVEGFRFCLLGTALPVSLVAISFASAALMFLVGVLFFQRMERSFADTI